MRAVSIVLIIIALLYYSIGFAQESTQNLTTFSVPKGTRRITKQEFLNQENQKFKHKLFESGPDERFFKNVYTNDGILISVYDWENLDDKRTMQQIQKEMTGMSNLVSEKRIKYSQIIPVNNVTFLIFEFKDDNDFSLWFMSEVIDGTRVQGMLHFSPQEEDKAKKTLDTLIHSIRFKRN
jgi:hypothetical protein